ncbi:MAG TPA: hypothetical protein VKX17_16130 [Planctomycetota bacterium]|nr:hypothetical protein [Planctomycetota bacterium]
MFSHGTQKSFWWFALAGASGVVLVIVLVLFDGAIERVTWRHAEWGQMALFSVLNIPIGALAVFRLRALYAKYPPRWTGRWQLGLADLMGVVFLFGTTMLFFRSVAPQSNFLSRGVPLTFAFSIGFLAALLFVSRVGTSRGLGRWLDAFGYTILALMTMVTGVLAQPILIPCVLLVVVLNIL